MDNDLDDEKFLHGCVDILIGKTPNENLTQQKNNQLEIRPF